MTGQIFLSAFKHYIYTLIHYYGMDGGDDGGGGGGASIFKLTFQR